LDVTTPADVLPASSPSKSKVVAHVELRHDDPDSSAFGIPQVAGDTQPELRLFPEADADLKGFFYENLFGSEDKCPDDLKDICKDLIQISAGVLSDAYETVEELRGITYDTGKLAACVSEKKIRALLSQTTWPSKGLLKIF
jgi:hypothetical protein